MMAKTSPDTRLQLEWVYGYRGHQCRSNVHYIANGDIVYFVAGVAVIYDNRKSKQRFYLEHNDDIISLTVNDAGTFVASGQVGKDPYICVWDPIAMRTVSILKDHHRHGVAALAFNASGERLVSVGLDPHSTVVVWEWGRGRMISTTRGHTDRIFDVCWDLKQADRFITCGVKHIKFWYLSGNTLISKKGIFGKVGELQTALCTCAANDGTVYSGMLSGDIYVWRGNNLEKSVPNVHKGGVFTIQRSASGFASGGKDGFVRLWDEMFAPVGAIDLKDTVLGYKGMSIRAVSWKSDYVVVGTNNSDVMEVKVHDPNSIKAITSGHSEGELWGLAAHPAKPIMVTGSDDGTLRLWSWSDHALLAKCHLNVAVRSCAFGPDLIAAGCIDGSVTVVRTRDMSTVTRIHDRKEAIHEIKFSPTGTYLAIASNDNFVDIYSVQHRFKKVGTCSKSSSFITHLDWSTDEKYIQTNDGAGERLIYHMPAGSHVTDSSTIQSIQWHTWTCVLGPVVAGIWPKYSQINDVNALCANTNLGIVATGDDSGLVKLLQYPCLKKGAKFRKYIGHSAHVTNVRFTSDGYKLLSVGGADHAIFQWKVGSEEDGSGVVDSLNSSQHFESNSEASDSSGSDVAEVDSEVEAEREAMFERSVDKHEIRRMHKVERRLNASEATKRSHAPEQASLTLNHVFGYRGYDCRGNLHYTQDGDIVYHIAAIGIVLSRSSGAQKHYLQHTDDILCLALFRSSKDLVATGQVGKKPSIHVWEPASLKTLAVLEGEHTHGICAVDFSGDGKRLASIGLDTNHTMVLWDWKRGEKLATARSHQDRVFCVKFDVTNNERLATVGVKHVKLWTHVGSGLTSKRGIFGKSKIDTMLCVAQGKTQFYTGGANGQVYTWEGHTLIRTQKAHDGPCFAMHALDRGFVTGGRDGVVSLWDENFERCLKSYSLNNQTITTESMGKLLEDNPSVRAINLGHGKILVGTKNGEVLEVDKNGPITVLTQGHGEGELWGLATHPSEYQCCTTSDDKTVRIWSTSGQLKSLNSRKMIVGGRCCAYSPDGTAIAVGRVDGSFVVLHATTLEEMVKFQPRKEAISDIRFSPEVCKYLAVASHDNFVDIYNVPSSKRVGVCKGASSYITHIDWDARGKLLRVNSGASELLYFEAPRGTRQTISDNTAIEWQTRTGVLGKKCEGIWPPCSDVTDVNACCLSRSGDLLATADDFGFVKLFKFPVVGKHAKFKQYVGHSAHVTNVRFSFDDSQLISVGGADTALCVWKRNDITIAAGDNELLQTKISYHGDSEDSDTDTEEDGGYDSDVAREKDMDYESKTYKTRDMKGIKLATDKSKKAQPVVNRSMKKTTKVSVSRGVTIDSVENLRLDHVFGYRGFDCRDNLHYIDDKIVYHAAGAGIVQDLTTGSQSFYLQHTDDIVSLAVNQHPKFAGIVASGQLGGEAPIHVWDTESKKTLSVMQGSHKKGICSLDFSASGKLLLSIGLEDEHSATVWRWQEGSVLCNQSCSSQRIFRAKFRPDSDSTFVTVGVKHVKFWSICGSSARGKRGVLGATTDIKMQTMLSIAFGAGDLTFTGSMSGDVFVWKGHILNRTVSLAHEGPVFSMFTTLRDGLIVTGGKDKDKKDCCCIKLWDQEMRRCRAFNVPTTCVKSICRGKGKIIIGTRDSQIYEVGEKSGACSALVQAHGEGVLSGLACHPTSHTCCTVSMDKTIRIWDVDEKLILHCTKSMAGGTACAYNRDGSLLVVGLSNGQIIMYEPKQMNELDSKRDRGSAINDLKFSPDGQILAAASSESVDIYNVSNKTLQRVTYIKHSGALQIDFSDDGRYLQVATEAYEKKIFLAHNGEPLKDDKIADHITWHTWTSFLGAEVAGIWPRDANPADINTAHVSQSGSSLVTGDDSGFVKLFRFPCPDKHTSFKKYTGHSAHVTGARFMCDDGRLVTTGGDDCCVFVWKTEN